MRAHEQDRLAGQASARNELAESVSLQLHVTTSSVAAGALPGDQPNRLEHVEVVGQQVRLRSGESPQLDRGPVRGDQLVDDRQPDRITDSGVPHGGTSSEGGTDRSFHSAVVESMCSA